MGLSRLDCARADDGWGSDHGGNGYGAQAEIQVGRGEIVDKTHKFLVMLSGALEVFNIVICSGGMLFFFLVAIKYAFTGVDDQKNWHLMGLCMVFGLMVYWWLDRPGAKK